MLSLNIQDNGSKGVQGTPSSLTGLLTHSAENNSLASPLDQGSFLTKAVLSSVSRGGNSKSTSNKSHHQHASTWASAQSSEHLSEIACTTKTQKGFKGDISGSESEDKGSILQDLVQVLILQVCPMKQLAEEGEVEVKR